MDRGFTLIELLVALAVMVVALGVTGLAVRSLEPTAEEVAIAAISMARITAIRTGAPVIATSGSLTVRFAPDGSAVSRVTRTHSLRVDPLTGEARVAR